MAESDAEVSSTTDMVVQVSDSHLMPHVDNEAITQAIDSITAEQDIKTEAMIDENQTITLASTSQEAVDALVDGSSITMASPNHAVVTLDVNALTSLGSQNGAMTILSTGDQSLTSAQESVVLTMTDQSIADSDNPTLQSLLAGSHGGSAQLATINGETIQIIQVANPSDLTNTAGKIWHVLPSANASEIATIIAINQQGEVETQNTESNMEQTESQESGVSSTATQVVDMVPVSSVPAGMTGYLMPPPSQPPQSLPPGCPTWAARLRDCEKIGDAYRGWVESEVELDLLLTYHKQQTQSFWGTRQSPSPAKQSTRLMWKSQYVPFDGVPFINSGSRAIVMECQYGPRRKGSQVRRLGDQIYKAEFKQTCPARIYIKKVRKFPEYRVDTTLDKKTLKTAMEKAFQLLKDRGLDGPYGQERYYVQLPTDKAHEFHQEADTPQAVPISSDPPHRLHPRVANKIREMVLTGETRLYAIRKALRRFVEHELFDSAEAVPEKHNLTYYPTVNDLQNHIHQAVKDLEVNVEVMGEGHSGEDSQELQGELWASMNQDDQPHPETVTVTLTQNPGEDGSHVISRVETHMSDGTTQISDSLTPETALLLSKLHPNMFPDGSLIQMQDTEVTGTTTASQVITMTAKPADTSPLPTTTDDCPEVSLQAENTLIGQQADTSIDLSEPMNISQLVQQGVEACTEIDPGSFSHGMRIIQETDGEVQILQEAGDEIPHESQFIQSESKDTSQLAMQEVLTNKQDDLQMTAEDNEDSGDMITIVTGDGQMILKYDNTEPVIKSEMDDAIDL